jgi:hypothetical protein
MRKLMIAPDYRAKRLTDGLKIFRILILTIGLLTPVVANAETITHKALDGMSVMLAFHQECEHVLPSALSIMGQLSPDDKTLLMYYTVIREGKIDVMDPSEKAAWCKRAKAILQLAGKVEY